MPRRPNRLGRNVALLLAGAALGAAAARARRAPARRVAKHALDAVLGRADAAWYAFYQRALHWFEEPPPPPHLPARPFSVVPPLRSPRR